MEAIRFPPTEALTVNKVQHIWAFFELAGSTNPKTPAGDNGCQSSVPSNKRREFTENGPISAAYSSQMMIKTAIAGIAGQEHNLLPTEVKKIQALFNTEKSDLNMKIAR